MFNAELFQPVVAQFALTFVLALATGGARLGARLTGATKGRELALGQLNWPTRVQQIANAFNNQFETPMLFYAAVIFAMLANVADPMLATLAWAYVATRVLHALIYVTVNIVLIRFLVFVTGFLCMSGMWLIVALAAL